MGLTVGANSSRGANRVSTYSSLARMMESNHGALDKVIVLLLVVTLDQTHREKKRITSGAQTPIDVCARVRNPLLKDCRMIMALDSQPNSRVLVPQLTLQASV